MREHILAALLIVLLAVALTQPGSGGYRHSVAATERSDVWNTMWLAHQVAHYVTGDGTALSRNEALGIPGGLDLWPHVGGIVWPVMMSPVILIVGDVFAQNFGSALALILAALSAYLFFNEISGDKRAALFSALFFGCGLYGLSEIHYGNPELAAIFPVPLSAFAVMRAFNKGGPSRVLLAAASLAFAFIFNVYFGFVAAAFALFACVRASRESGNCHAYGRLAIMLAQGALLSLPILWPVGRGLFAAAYDRSAAIANTSSWDLLEPLFFFRTYPRTFCYSLVLVAVGGLYRAEKGYHFWLLAAAGFFLLALGPSIHFLGWNTGLPGPFRLISLLPGGWRARYAYRFAVGFHLCMGAAAAVTLRRLIEYAPKRGIPGAVAGRAATLFAIVAAVAMVSSASLTVQAPRAYEVLAHKPEAGAVIELPMTRDTYIAGRRLYFQTLHGRPVIDRYPLPDLPESWRANAFDDNRVFSIFSNGAWEQTAAQEAEERMRDRESLAKGGVRFALAHLQDPGGREADETAGIVFGEPVYADDSEKLYLIE